MPTFVCPPGRSTVSLASRKVWNWQERDAGIDSASRAASRRQRWLIQGFVLAVLGTVLNMGLGHTVPGRVVLVVGVLQMVIALWRPRFLIPLDRIADRIAAAVGHTVAWLLLTPFWLLVIVPGGFILRLQRRDPLHRASLPTDLTGWVPRRRASDPASTSHQFLIEDRGARALERPVGTLPDPALLAELADLADVEDPT